MIEKFNKAALLFIVFASAIIVTSCEDNNCEDNYAEGECHYLVTTQNKVDYYFSPKKLNIFAENEHKVICGDWLHNNEKEDDSNQEYAQHFYFLDNSAKQKYLELAQHAKAGDVVIDKNDIINPYKAYADFYGDTVLTTHHTSLTFTGLNACVLPVTRIDIKCDKDFDENHPAGSLLNDIITIHTYCNIYGTLHDTDENGVPMYKINVYPQYNAEIVPTLLSSIPENPIQMLESRFYLTFQSEPSESGTYEFTVKFSFGADPITGKTVDIAPAMVKILF